MTLSIYIVTGMSEESIIELKKKIFGDILAADDIGGAMRRWRMFFNISQVDLAKFMNISSSVLSEYENDPKKSPGARFIKRYVDALVEIDMSRGGKILDLLASSYSSLEVGKEILKMRDYLEPFPAKKLIEVINVDVLVGEDRVENLELYGYTVLDSVAAILSMSGNVYYKIFGRSTERALIFTNVSTGRSPLVAVRVYPLKPRMVVLHGPKNVDPLAIKIAEREHIILGISRLRFEPDLLQSLDKLDELYE